MSKKDLLRSDHLANPHQHRSDDEDGTDTSSANSDTSIPENIPHFPTSSRVAQPNQGHSSGPRIEVNAKDNINMSGKQRAGNVTASFLPQTGRFFTDASNNLNGGKLQNVGNLVFRNVKPKKMSDPSKKSHKNRSFTDIGSHSRNPKHHQGDDTSEITSREVLEPDASSESNYAYRNHSPAPDPPAAQDPVPKKSSRKYKEERGHYGNPDKHNQSDDTSEVISASSYAPYYSTIKPAPGIPLYVTHHSYAYPRAHQRPSQGESSGPNFKFDTGCNRNLSGEQRSGNVRFGGSVPQHGQYVFKTGNNFNKGVRQESGNVDFGVNAEVSHQGQISNSILKATETNCEGSKALYIKCLVMLILAVTLIMVFFEMRRLIQKMKFDSFGL